MLAKSSFWRRFSEEFGLKNMKRYASASVQAFEERERGDGAMAVGRLVQMLLLLLATILLPRLSFAFSEEEPANRRVLVLVDDLDLKSSHSLFFKSLTDREHELDIRLADDESLVLEKYGEYLYDALVLFAPSVEFLGKRGGGSLDVSAILAFVDSGHDLILAGDITTSEFMRDIATECGADFDEDAEAVVIDHMNFAGSDSQSDHTFVVGEIAIDSAVILGPERLESPVIFRGIAHSTNPSSALVVQVLSASKTAYSANPDAELTDPPALTGSSIALVSVVQARNNARILISGSLDIFSDKHPTSGNHQFVVELSKWTFHERGHLKAINVHHHKVGEEEEPGVYRITDNLEYSVEIYAWTGKKWQPYEADDVQLQFYMMSPYVLKNLSHNGKGLYYMSFKVPDVYGVFQFKVDYRRLGFTSLSLSKQIPVRPFRHNEYERFIKAAYPYYGGAFSMMTGFFVFGIVFLYNK